MQRNAHISCPEGDGLWENPPVCCYSAFSCLFSSLFLDVRIGSLCLKMMIHRDKQRWNRGGEKWKKVNFLSFFISLKNSIFSHKKKPFLPITFFVSLPREKLIHMFTNETAHVVLNYYCSSEIKTVTEMAFFLLFLNLSSYFFNKKNPQCIALKRNTDSAKNKKHPQEMKLMR